MPHENKFQNYNKITEKLSNLRGESHPKILAVNSSLPTKKNYSLK